ncbi:MAG: hypothetical protein ACYDAJ_04495 [Nitrosotalea sp.]
MVNKSTVTCIQVTRETKKCLDNLGKKGMSYEEIIISLLPKGTKEDG